ncbi:16S rRNA (cytosine(1402)-N(4))-methyltransferase RsmH [Arcanobacterium bovis]|uniref:Ribosomal RNA small subunit methyltransferase H n=2 Tax=Arcanobacterium bovis TaxID=2529275 RepID=A0A4Q9V1R2_9ACTO|nr:16S rRNA (cytosine(1402)-N(4))-methyltransferase RsmH [Arcanobacterium bovis]TBW23031.1 16S rRNA (cytosine(1402)-N(4))-methyltransferase RsmH [Arcanobacterium bovis]
MASHTRELRADDNALHLPVLLRTCLDLMAPAIRNDGSVVIDCTLGMGGHTEGILSEFPHVTVVGIDRDPQAIELASQRLQRFGERFHAVHTTYDDVDRVAAKYGQGGKVDAILMDLGVSSLQLDAVERGFSYAHEAPLDMRMNPSQGMSAKELLNSADSKEIARILRVYGEEKFAAKIAQEIVRRREIEALETTTQLVDIVRDSLPAAAKRTGGNPAKRTFQAIRIAVNSELSVLEAAVPRAIESLRVGGRLVVESYQSLEDRIVKDAFKQGLQATTPPGLPMELEDHKPYLKAVVRGALKADDDELARNSRAASVRLRAVERLRATPSHVFNKEHYRGDSL